MKRLIACTAALLLITTAVSAKSRKTDADSGATKKSTAAKTVTAVPAPAASVSAASIGMIASTPWTAAFADIAGVDDTPSIAPADMKHPPEYEITVSDLQKVTAGRYLVYSGFERMMKTIAEAAGSVQLIKLSTDNSVAKVASEARKIAAVTRTEAECEKRIASYKQTVADAKALAAAHGITTKKCLVHTMQVPLAKELGLQIAGTFGPAPVTAAQIADAKTQGYDIIIDNVHNPVAAPLAEVLPTAKLVVWRNFPAETGRAALEHVVQANAAALVQ